MMDSGKAKPGDLVFPHRFSMENVIEKQAEGYIRFAMQHMLICSLSKSNKFPLRLADLMVADVHPAKAPVTVVYGQRDSSGTTALEGIKLLGLGNDRLYRPAFIDKVYADYTGTKGGLDPSGRGDDKTGLAIVSHLTGHYYVKCCLGLTGGADTESMDRIASLCRQHDCRDLYLEGNIDVFGSYELLLEQALRRHFLEPNADPRFPAGWKCSLTTSRATMQKELRIIGVLEPIITSHRMIVDRSVVEPEDGEPLYNQFQYQLTRLQKVRKCLKEDGRIDALAIAVSAWEASLGISPEKSRERTVLEMNEKALREKGLLPPKPESEGRWFSLPGSR
jgi:hypothetical protein